MLVQVKKNNNDIISDIEFDFKYFKNHIHIQCLTHFKSQIRTVNFNNQLFLYQIEKKSIQENHLITNIIKNNLAEILLKFFIF